MLNIEAEFGYGTVVVCGQFRKEGNKITKSMLTIRDSIIPLELGDQKDDLENIAKFDKTIRLLFSNVESIDVVIDDLRLLREDFIKVKGMNVDEFTNYFENKENK